MTQSKHALVVGGTGMLAGASLWLADQGYHLSVVARNSQRMESLMQKTGSGSLTPLYVDYREEDVLREELQKTIEKNGPVQVVVAWIHTIGKNALQIIADTVSENKEPCVLYHVLGSSSDLRQIKQKAMLPGKCDYRQIQLGFILEGNISRWLTDTEISNGVIEAIQNDTEVYVVGVLEPWEKRP